MDFAAPVTNYIWNTRYGTETTIRIDLNDAQKVIPVGLNQEAYYYFKVENSGFIEWNDCVAAFKSPKNLEHHLFLTSDDVIEVLSLFEPKIVVDEKLGLGCEK